jgi:UDP-N-acetylglucosamine enolpyruvyl transferase|tara:strand:+ start:400 stop:816 length:417 start_codon:yes stop_codon:yes gene_type:complete
MATTTAAVTLTSDLLSDALSVSTTTTCMKAGTVADGLTQMDMGYIEIATGDVYDILDATALGVNKANKVLIANDSTDETYYLEVTIKAEMIGRLYAGDWMWIPWGAGDDTTDIGLEAKVGTNKVTYTLFHEGRTLVAS